MTGAARPDRHLLGLGLVDVGLLRHLGLAVFAPGLAVDVLVPQQGAAGALLAPPASGFSAFSSSMNWVISEV